MGFGNVPGRGQSNWDMSLAKLIKIREGQNLQFRTAFYNTFNHPQRGSEVFDQTFSLNSL